MNEQERAELMRLHQRQARLAQELEHLSQELKQFEQRLSSPESERPGRAPDPDSSSRLASATPTTAGSIQPARVPAPSPAPRQAAAPVAANAIPPIIPTVPVAQTAQAPIAEPALIAQTPASKEGAPAAWPAPNQPSWTPRPPTATPSATRQPGSLEMRLGTFWLVRIGIVLVLTGLVFFGTLAYQNYISHFGPAGKTSLLYFATALLLGAGWFLQRPSAQETLRNYAQVLFAGGLAALYFTTYAAHYVQALRIIESPGVDGILLLLCAAFMVWIADRKKSEVLAVFAVGLAYYTSVITRVGYFTLYSNLLLTSAAVLFLVRNRWVVISFGSLVASYGAYGFWRFFDGNVWHWAPVEGIWAGTWFLFSYWLVLTAAVFLSRAGKFAGPNRASFLTLNNSALFGMFLLTMVQVRQGGFWKFSLIYGCGLVGLSEAARLLLPKEPLTKNSYLTQGLLLVTVGLISKFAGLQLALFLAMESVVLLVAGQQRKNLVLLTGAYIAAGLSVGWAMDGLHEMEAAGVWLALGIGGLMLAGTLLVHRELAPRSGQPGTAAALAGAQAFNLRPGPSYFTVLALVMWFAATWNNTARQDFPLVLALEAALFALSIYLLRVPEITWLALGYLALAQVVWVADVFAGALSLPWWNPLLMLGLTLSLNRWWMKQKIMGVRPDFRGNLPALLPVLFKNLVLLGAAQLAVTLTGGWDLGDATQRTLVHLWLPITLGVLLLADVLLAHPERSAIDPLPLRLGPAYSTLLTLAVWLAITWHSASRQSFPLVLAAEGVLWTFSFYLLRVPELTLLSQGYLLLAQITWVLAAAAGKALPPWWNPLLLLAMTLLLSHWWQRQTILRLDGVLRQTWQALYGLATVGVLAFWLAPKLNPPAWLAVTGLLAVGLTAYGVFTRAWFVAVCGQIFVLVSAVQFAEQLWEGKPEWYFALVPLAVLGWLSAATVGWFRQKPGANTRVRQPLLQLALLYRWVGLVMAITWVCEYIPVGERPWVLAVLGWIVFVWAGLRPNREALLISAVFSATALTFWWLPWLDAPKVYWPNLLWILGLSAQRQIASRRPMHYSVERGLHVGVIIIAGVSLWRFLSLWVSDLELGGSYLTASWSLLALAWITTGIVLRERVYRWLGLALLACALARIVVFDIWKLEAIYRILSLLALGVVLLLLGFVYNRFQEKIKEWL